MRFLADMGVSLRVVEWLRSSGHDAIHLRDEGLQKLPNGEIFRKAIREQRVGWVERRRNPSSFAETMSSTRRRKRRSARLAVKKKLPLQIKFCR
jgi:hypothetical protein